MSISRGLIAALTVTLFCSAAALAQTPRDPVIIIPGLQGSEILDTSGKHVWFSVRRSKTDDIRLPINSPILSHNRDTNRAGDIIRKIDIKLLPDVQVYQSVIDALTEKGYTEATWDSPKADNVFYVFPYDWHRDNVENAQLLIKRMAAVRKATHRPNLKFNILAHSMGGLIARYAAMYGPADLGPEGSTPVPTWAGAGYINKLMMFGTPNEGSMNAFEGLINGASIISNRKLPLIDDFRAEDVFSSPSVFQLLPHHGHFLDEDLKPLDVDLYDPKTWEKYGWGPLWDAKFLSKLKDAPQIALTNKDVQPKELGPKANLDDKLLTQTTFAQAHAYFVAALSRAKRFTAALDVVPKKTPIQLYAFGGNCTPTLDGAVLIHDDNDNKWTTVLDARDIKAKDGKEFKKEEVKNAIFTLGDGRVTQHSLLAATQKTTDGKPEFIDPAFPLTSAFFGCGTHIKLFLDKPIQDSFLDALVVEKHGQP